MPERLGAQEWKDAEQDDDSRVEAKMIRDVAEQRVGPEEAAQALLQHVQATNDLEQDDGAVASMFIMAALYFSIQQHACLVEMLACLFRLQAALDERDGSPEYMQKAPYKLNLIGDYFGMDMNYEWNRFDPKGFELDELVPHWTRLNHFTALMTSTDVERMDFSLFGLWTLREALESPITTNDKDQLWHLNYRIPGAAQWIFVRGVQIFASKEEFRSSDSSAPARGHELWAGYHGYCRGRWDVWKRQFGQMAQVEGLEERTRRAAAEAEARMAEIESS